MKGSKMYSVSIFSIIMLMLTNSIIIDKTLVGHSPLVGFTHDIIAKKIVQNMTLEQKVGQMFIVDASRYNSNIPTGGVILFQNNLESIDQIIRLTDRIQESSEIPLFIGIDQEGGAINRLPMGTTMPGNMAIGATGSNKYAYQTGKLIGNELSTLGINLNFAPVLDVNNNPLNPVIGIRSFSSDPNLVGSLGTEYIKGLRKSRVIPAGKHFPGHGDTDIDSHFGLPQINHGIERLKKVELKPFQRVINRDIEMIMTAHVTFPAIDNIKVKSKRNGQEITIPATLSEKVLTDLLRDEMGFKGIVITDAFNMKAITDHFNEEQAVLKAIDAGADIVLKPLNVEGAYNRVLKEIKAGNISEERIDKSVIRIISLKSKYGMLKNLSNNSLSSKVEYSEKIIRSDKHMKIEEDISDRSTTLLINENDMLPFNAVNGDNILLFMPNIRNENITKPTIKNILYENNIDIKIDSVIYSRSTRLGTVHKNKIDKANYIIIGTHNIESKDGRANYINSIINYTNEKNIPAVIMSLGTPYDITYLDEVKAYITSYGDFKTNINSNIKAIFGEVTPKGTLPVEIPSKEGSHILYKLGHGLEFKFD